MKSTQPITNKLKILVNHLPQRIAFSGFVSVPSAATSAGDNTYFKSEKSTPPVACPTTGIMMSDTNPLTTKPTAPAKITAIAKSITFPVIINSLNSFNILNLGF